MKFILALFACALLCTSLSMGQMGETDSLSQVEISKLEFLVGEWEGPGWIMGRDRQKHGFQQTEDVRFKVDKTTILIEGLGKSNGQVTHSALAVISFDKEDGNYNFQSYLADGRSGSFKAELIGNKLHWYPMENTRYIIFINDEGQWHETGEMNIND